MTKYKHIFFDLDRTLWDLENNSVETLHELFEKYELKNRGVTNFDQFIKIYKGINKDLWDLYREGEITKEFLRNQRFKLTLKKFDIENAELAEKLGDYYVENSPYKKRLFPHTIEALDYLKKKYQLHIITNGFEEVQHIKMKISGLDQYFEQVVTSEAAGAKKPRKEIFEYSLNIANAKAEESLMIGDDLAVDIIGAKNAGVDQVFVNYFEEPHEEGPTYEIKSLDTLMEIL